MDCHFCYNLFGQRSYRRRGIAPLILGYQAFDRNIRIAGVILNRLGGRRHEAKLRAVIEHYTDVPVLGAVQEDAELALVERHLGLMPANETAEAEHHIAAIGERIAAQVDLDRLLAVSRTDVALPAPPLPAPSPDAPVRIAIARDAAFGFYYADDLDALAAAGAQTVYFDTLKDPKLPPCDGLLIGGGFPECFLDGLEANAPLRADIRRAIEGGLPTYAECGGLMYLARSIEWQGRSAAMVGVIPGDIQMHAKPVGRGYVILEADVDHPWRASGPIAGSAEAPDAGSTAALLHAHEFHYSSVAGLPADTRYAYAVRRGYGIDGKHDGILLHRLLASYTHLRATSGCDWPARFVRHVRACLTVNPEEAIPCSP